jgi:hypothetical protein
MLFSRRAPERTSTSLRRTIDRINGWLEGENAFAVGTSTAGYELRQMLMIVVAPIGKGES